LSETLRSGLYTVDRPLKKVLYSTYAFSFGMTVAGLFFFRKTIFFFSKALAVPENALWLLFVNLGEKES